MPTVAPRRRTSQVVSSPSAAAYRLAGQGIEVGVGGKVLAGGAVGPVVESYVVCYEALHEGIDVVRLLHGSRDVDGGSVT